MVDVQFCRSSWRLVHRETWYKIIMKFEKNYYSMKQQDSTKNYPDTVGVWSKNFNQQNKKMKDLCTCGKDPLLVSIYSIVWRVWYGSCTMLVLSVLWIRNFNDFQIQPDSGKSSRSNRIWILNITYYIRSLARVVRWSENGLVWHAAPKKTKKIPQLVVDGAGLVV